MADDDDDVAADEEQRVEGVPDLTSAKSQREAKKRARQAERERSDVLRELLSTTQGRRFFAWLLHDTCGLYRPVANAAFDPHALHFREGARAVGQVLHDFALQEAPAQYIVLLGEALTTGRSRT